MVKEYEKNFLNYDVIISGFKWDEDILVNKDVCDRKGGKTGAEMSRNWDKKIYAIREGVIYTLSLRGWVGV